MDGTIVCSMHRYRTITVDNMERIDICYWRENEHRALGDSLLPLAEQYKLDINDSNCIVIIATARILRTADYTFIDNILGTPDYIISRNEFDTRSGSTIKIEGLIKFFARHKETFKDVIFYEDNVAYLKSVCDYFNIRGIYIPSKQGH
jgi:hypothetical protein